MQSSDLSELAACVVIGRIVQLTHDFVPHPPNRHHCQISEFSALCSLIYPPNHNWWPVGLF